MNNDKKPVYRFSTIKMFRSVLRTIFSNEWQSWLFISVTSILIVAIWMAVSQKHLAEYVLTPVIDSFILAIMFGTWGYLGYLSAKHRFFPSSLNRPITGNYALLVGIIMMMIGWGFAIYLLFLTISNLIGII